jgi:hypothetical protein
MSKNIIFVAMYHCHNHLDLNTHFPFYTTMGGLQSFSERLAEEDNLSSVLRIEQWFLDHSAGRAAAAIQTGLFRLSLNTNFQGKY